MSDSMDRLLAIMARLRDPAEGCPWDVEQSFASIAPHTIEEAYEVADAIARDDLAGLKDELGDLLLQVVFHARMAEEQGAFAFADVAAAICDKLVRRHPHVFADARIHSAEAQTHAWERHKEAERASGCGSCTSQMHALTLPAARSALSHAWLRRGILPLLLNVGDVERADMDPVERRMAEGVVESPQF